MNYTEILDSQLVSVIFIGFGLSFVLIIVSYLLSVRKWDIEKLSPYECGFEPYGDARAKFDVRFWLISLIFLLFDLEISYLFPFVLVLESGYLTATVFIIILTIGFVFEFKSGALDEI